MGSLSKEDVAEAIKRKAAENAAPPKEASMFDRLKNWASKNGDDAIAEVGKKFADSGGNCQAISTRPDMQALKTFEGMTETQKAKIPGVENVTRAVDACKI